MNLETFLKKGYEISQKAGVSDAMRVYFKQAAPRLHLTFQIFQLSDNSQIGDVLDIGPFFGYTPFILRNQATSYIALEGDDPVVHCLRPLYDEYQSGLKFIDFFEIFGPTESATHTLEFQDSSFNTILCWETMEHFGFNPVKFVREIYRILKPGGRACITVPNKASFQAIESLISGRHQREGINSYFEFENYQCNGKTAFYGFHWREYTPLELSLLFKKVGFNVARCGGFSTFHDHGTIGILRRSARWISKFGTSLAPRYGTNVFLEAIKPF